MTWDCPLCTCEESVERIESSDEKTLARCTACHATFRVDNDYSWDSERWVDYSTLGKEEK